MIRNWKDSLCDTEDRLSREEVQLLFVVIDWFDSGAKLKETVKMSSFTFEP